MTIFGNIVDISQSNQIVLVGALMLMQSKCVESSDFKLRGPRQNVPFYKTSKQFAIIGDISGYALSYLDIDRNYQQTYIT